MDSTDPKVKQLVVAVHDTIAALDELVFLLRVAHNTPQAQEAQSLVAESLARAKHPPQVNR
jgi:hypothetical protein